MTDRLQKYDEAQNRKPAGRQLKAWTPTVPQPGFVLLQRWEGAGGCEAIDGCWVEPDGYCPHGEPSWLLYLGLI